MKQRFKMIDLCMLGMLFMAGFFYMRRIPIGMVLHDESFTVSLALRLIQGDALIVQEWNLASISAVLLIPFVRLYLMIAGTSEGIYLVLRYVTVLIQFVVAILFYLLNRNRGMISVFMSTMFVWFIPLQILSLTYNSIPLMCLFLVSGILISPYTDNKILQFVCGALIGISILCQPYLLILCAVYILVVTANQIKMKKDYAFFTWIGLGRVVLGALFVASVFLVYLFSHTSISSIIEVLPILLDDPTHQSKTLYDLFLLPFTVYGNRLNVFRVVFAVCFVFGWYTRKNKKMNLSVFLVLMLSCLAELMMLSLFLIRGYGEDVLGMNGIMIVLSKLGLFAYAFSKDRDLRMMLMWILGALFGFCNHVASNQNFFTISTAMTLSSVASVPMVYTYLKEHVENEKFGSVLMAVILSVQLFAEGHVLMNHVFHENELSDMTVRIERGPAKGVYTSEKLAQEYNTILSDFDEYEPSKDTPVLFLDNQPIAYVYADRRVGSYSVWNEQPDYFQSARVKQYFEWNPDHVPGFIYVDNATVIKNGQEMYRNYAREAGYTVRDCASGALILEME